MDPNVPASTVSPVQSPSQVPSIPSASKKMTPLIIAAIVTVILLIGAVFLMKRTSSNPQEVKKESKQASVTRSPVKDNKMYSFPQVTVKGWVIPSTMTVQPPSTALLYQYKQNITVSDFRLIAGEFFTVDTVQENPKRILAYSTQAGASMFYLQKASGSFLFSADRGITQAASGSAGITALTQKLMKDASLELSGEYDKSNEPGIRYYEFHRSWEKVGLPVLNLFGLFNNPVNTPLKSLSLSNAPGRVKNPVYVNTTDSSDGLSRANEFNTVTVGVKGGKITSVVSNVRPVESAPGSSPVITYDQAVAKLKTDAYTYIYTSPEGTGTVDHEKLYPQNKAILTSATVDDVIVAYLEELPKTAQKQLIPYYIFKGTGKLQSGYTVKFLAAVQAISSGVLGTSTVNTSLLAQNGLTGVPVGNNSSQQQGTLQFEEQGGMLPGSAPVANNLPAGTCDPPPSPQDLTDVQQDANGIIFGRAPRDGDGDIEWYVVPGTDWDVEKLKDAVNVVWNSATNNTIESDDEKLRRIAKVVSDFEEQSAGCPVRVTGSSPSVFIHSDVSQTLSVVPGSVVTYADPSLTSSGWTAQVTGDSILTAGQRADYLYYEYVPVTFSRPQSGWNVGRASLDTFAKNVSRQFGLTAIESSRLSFELRHAAYDVPGSNLFLGLVPQSELGARLPLGVRSTKQIDSQRIQFYVAHADGQTPVSPAITPVRRSSFYLLEIGAAAQ